jgi:ArsR family transcriptional regulator, nickel/cobalt-responsive transcriptional repressor
LATRRARPISRTVTTNDCAQTLRALGDATRLAVLQALLQHPHRVGDLQAALQIEQSLLSHHLKILRDAGLVEANRDGKSVVYRVAPQIAGAREPQCLDLECCQVVFRPAKESP